MCPPAPAPQGLTSGFLHKVAEAQVGGQGPGLAGQMRTLGLRVLGAAAMGAPPEWAAPSCLPLTWHRLAPPARQAGNAEAQAEQGTQGQRCSDSNTQEGQLHAGIQQTCMDSMAPSAPLRRATAPHPPPNTYLGAGGKRW